MTFTVTYTVPIEQIAQIPDHIHKMVCYLLRQPGKESTQAAVDLVAEATGVGSDHAQAIVGAIGAGQKESLKLENSGRK